MPEEKNKKPKGMSGFKEAQDKLRKLIDWAPDTPMAKRRKKLKEVMNEGNFGQGIKSKLGK